VILLFLSTLPSAWAAPVPSGLQGAVFGDGLGFIEDRLAGLTFDLAEDDVGGEVGCYDRLGVRDFNLHVPIDSVRFDLGQDTLDITVNFDQIYAENFSVYGQDEDYLDTCIEFDADVLYAELNDAVLHLSVGAGVQDGALALTVEGTPQLQGDLDTDIDWFPDDIALYYFEEMILDYVAESIGDMLPDLVATYASALMYGDRYGDFEVEVGLDAAAVSADAMELSASPSIAWVGTDGCPTDDRSDGAPGANPTLSFGDGDGSSIALGATEGTVNELFLAAWRDGYFCFTEDNVDEFLGLIADAFDPEIGGLSGTASLREPPEVTIDADGIHFKLADIGATVTGDLNGQTEQLLDIRGTVTGLLDLGIDQALSSFTLTVRDLDFAVDTLQADHLVDGTDGEDKLRHFIEDWAGGWASTMASDLVLFQSLYYFWDIALRVDRVETTDGGLQVYVSLYDADDPAVDTSPPDTRFSLSDVTDEYVELFLEARDDRDGPLAFSVQLDGAGWSAWSTDDHVQLKGLQPGVTEIEVISRDQWLNVDPSPAVQWLEIGEDGKPVQSCACAAGQRRPVVAWALLPLLGGLVLRRRRDPTA